MLNNSTCEHFRTTVDIVVQPALGHHQIMQYIEEGTYFIFKSEAL